ncbi:hypothetical protein [Streptomyces spongiae]|uniref:Uncharacterized protein n=1 Tax=Streptomyces spongiae TaxID=565072 RepID=A0A5N8XMV5_9ACTN|nr:hypothetical protein [Streptomyces spongiae]MPY60348.1 hypothetical protein [Streptomyces spongiae]
MKLRHVRAVAVFGIAVIALTGARHSHGGGCSSGSSSSSSSSSSGGSTGSTTGDVGKDDDHDDYDYDTTTTGGASTSGSTSGSTGGNRSNRAAKDVKIESCAFDAARGIVARVRATNGSAATTYTYEFNVTFKGPDGSVVRTSNSTIPYVSAGSSETLDVAAAYVPADGENVNDSTCGLSAVTRTSE